MTPLAAFLVGIGIGSVVGLLASLLQGIHSRRQVTDSIVECDQGVQDLSQSLANLSEIRDDLRRFKARVLHDASPSSTGGTSKVRRGGAAETAAAPYSSEGHR